MRYTTRRTARPVTRPITRPVRRRRPPGSSPVPLVLVVVGLAALTVFAWAWSTRESRVLPPTSQEALTTDIASSRLPTAIPQATVTPKQRVSEAVPPVRPSPGTMNPAPAPPAIVTPPRAEPPASPTIADALPPAAAPTPYSAVKLDGAVIRVWPANAIWEKLADHPDSRPKMATKDGKLTIPVKASLAGKNGLEFAYRIPLGSDGKPMPTADRMVFYGPWISQGLDSISTIPWLRDLSEREGLTVFTVKISGPYKTEDKTSFYPYRESGWFDAVFDAQKQIAEVIGCRLNPIVVTGDSAGGSLGQQLAAAEPKRVSAAAFGGGGMFSAQRAPTPHLVLSTLGDANNGVCRSLVGDMHKSKAMAVFQIADREGTARSRPHYEHTTGPLGRQLLGAYAAGAAKEQDVKKWPYLINVGAGTGPYAAKGQPKPTWRDVLHWKFARHPLVPGNECPGAGIAPLPSQSVADLISRMPSAFRSDYVGAGGGKIRLIIGGPAFLGSDEVSGVIIYQQPYASDVEGLMVENCMRLAQSGIVVIAPCDPSTPDDTDRSWWLGLADEVKSRLGRDVGVLRVYEAWEDPRPSLESADLRKVSIDAGGREPTGTPSSGSWVSAMRPLLLNSGREWDAVLRIAIHGLGGGGRWDTLP